MRMSQLVGKRTKETPKDAQTQSHIFLIRGGYARPVSTGIYSLLPLAKRITQKIEKIIREEMNRIEGQEVLMPVVLPRELWEESGRYQSVGPELLRFKDRNGKDMLLGMTHEEAVVHLARSEVSSYKQMPFMLYQIQTKYRDEARPRAGLIRVREFTMKDAYSFHTSDECLKKYYDRAHAAYVRIFERLGMKNVFSIESDTGMMGGAVSHEFMAVSDCGEDTIFVCPGCDYKANREVAKTKVAFACDPAKPLERVHTPNQKTIEEVATFLGIKTSETGKAVFYTDDDGKLYFVVIRGDIEVNETKLRNHLKLRELKFANDEQIRSIGAVPGYASPLQLNSTKVRIIIDPSVAHSSNLVVGANEADYHYKGFNFTRDLQPGSKMIDVVDIAAARNGDPCPVSGHPLKEERGIEVGNIFQLGTKYSVSMNCTYLDQNGKSHPMIMGCYGIGVGRSMAAVIEQSHDKYGPIWPLEIAPYQVHICALNMTEGAVKETADKLYYALLEKGVEVLYDDRNEKAGSAFNDADLIGIPFRIILSPKNLAENVAELKARDGSLNEKTSLDLLQQRILDLLNRKGT
ncbi:proline--tRNA ligase [Bdellovibrionota bacterium FG-2]